MYTTITAKSHPKLHKALLNIAKDNLDVTRADETLPKAFNITDKFDIKSIEKSLDSLTRIEFEDFTIGDYDIRNSMLTAYPDLKEFTELSILFYQSFIKQDKTIKEITIEI